jgi:hypothetical protein
LIEGHEQLKTYITNYYKGLFGWPEESSFSLDETQIADIPQVSLEENALLTAPYSEDEINRAIFLMEPNKAQMVFLLSSIRLFGKQAKWTFYKCLVFYTLDS